MKKLFATIAASMLMTCAIAADNGVLIQNAPVTDRRAAVLDIVASAFIGRGWSVDSVDQTSVTASLENSKLRIYVEGTSLMYEEIGRMISIPVGPGAAIKRKASNERWRSNIRKDVSAHLARLGTERPNAAPSATAGSMRTVAERLAELESLRVSGLVTDGEYSQKRQEILKGL